MLNQLLFQGFSLSATKLPLSQLQRTLRSSDCLYLLAWSLPDPSATTAAVFHGISGFQCNRYVDGRIRRQNE